MTPTISAAGYLERIGPEPDCRSAVELIWIQATVSRIRIACEKMTPPALRMLRASVAGAASLPPRRDWERKAAAHPEVFRCWPRSPVTGQEGTRAAGRESPAS